MSETHAPAQLKVQESVYQEQTAFINSELRRQNFCYVDLPSCFSPPLFSVEKKGKDFTRDLTINLLWIDKKQIADADKRKTLFMDKWNPFEHQTDFDANRWRLDQTADPMRYFDNGGIQWRLLQSHILVGNLYLVWIENMANMMDSLPLVDCLFTLKWKNKQPTVAKLPVPFFLVARHLTLTHAIGSIMNFRNVEYTPYMWFAKTVLLEPFFFVAMRPLEYLIEVFLEDPKSLFNEGEEYPEIFFKWFFERELFDRLDLRFSNRDAYIRDMESRLEQCVPVDAMPAVFEVLVSSIVSTEIPKGVKKMTVSKLLHCHKLQEEKTMENVDVWTESVRKACKRNSKLFSAVFKIANGQFVNGDVIYPGHQRHYLFLDSLVAHFEEWCRRVFKSMPTVNCLFLVEVDEEKTLVLLPVPFYFCDQPRILNRNMVKVFSLCQSMPTLGPIEMHFTIAMFGNCLDSECSRVPRFLLRVLLDEQLWEKKFLLVGSESNDSEYEIEEEKDDGLDYFYF